MPNAECRMPNAERFEGTEMSGTKEAFKYFSEFYVQSSKFDVQSSTFSI